MPMVPGTPFARVDQGVFPNLSFASPGAGVAPDVRISAPQVGPMQLTTSLFNPPSLSTPQLRGGTLRPYEPNPAAISAPRLSDRGAQQMVDVGNNLLGTSDELGKLAMAMQAKVNATVVDDAVDQARQAAMKLTWGTKDEATGNVVGGYKNLKGEQAFRRPSETGLDDEIGQQFDDAVKGIVESKITNPLQRQSFEHQVMEIGSQLRQGAAIHQAEQFDAYHDGVYKSMAENLTADFAMVDPRDLNAQKDALAKLDQTVATRMITAGAPAEALTVAQRSARSAAVASLFDRVVSDKNYLQAQALLNQWGDKIDPDVATKMKLSIDGHVAVQLGQQIGADVYSHTAAPSFSAGDATRAFNVVIGMESGGKHTDDKGKVLKDGKGMGSVGIAQLQPDTAKAMAKKLGHPEWADLAMQPTKDGEAANRLLGQAYFNELVGQFKGDIPKAMAAYNAGPAWLVGGKDRKGNKIEGALKQAAREGGDWRDYIPAETRDYVAKGMRSFGAGEGMPPRPTKADLLARIDAQTTDPDVRRAAYSYVDQRYAADEQGLKDKQEQAYAEGLRIVRETGGNLNAVPPALKGQIKPEQFKELEGYGRDIVDGKYRTTDPAAYLTVMDPKVVERMSATQLEAFRPQLSDEDYKKARQLWQDTHQPAPAKSPDSLDVGTLDSLVNTRLTYLGLNPDPAANDPGGRARVGAIRQFAHQYVLDLQKQAGKKLETYGDLETAVNNMFLKEQGFRTTVFGVTTGHGKQSVLTSQVRDLPTDTRAQLKAAFKKQRGRDPSDAELLQAYFRSQFYR
jgi:hypothetical protein